MPNNIDDLAENEYIRAVLVDSQAEPDASLGEHDPAILVIRQAYRDGLTITQASERVQAFLGTSPGTE